MKTVLPFLLFLSLALSARASDTVALDAGELTGPSGAAMSDGSLLLLIATDTNPENTFDETLAAGQFVSGNDYVLAAASFNTFNGTNETGNTLTFSGNAGDNIALRWFPGITLAQYQSGTIPINGNSFGTYFPGITTGTPTGATPDLGSPWIVASNGSLIDLQFYTANSDFGGTQAPSEGFADFLVGGSQTTPMDVPEPSTYALFAAGLALLILRLRYQRILACNK